MEGSRMTTEVAGQDLEQELKLVDAAAFCVT
jgi:hypothetical protein